MRMFDPLSSNWDLYLYYLEKICLVALCYCLSTNCFLFIMLIKGFLVCFYYSNHSDFEVCLCTTYWFHSFFLKLVVFSHKQSAVQLQLKFASKKLINLPCFLLFCLVDQRTMHLLDSHWFLMLRMVKEILLVCSNTMEENLLIIRFDFMKNFMDFFRRFF